MKKTLIISQSIIMILFYIFLPDNILIEEILTLLFISIFIAFLIFIIPLIVLKLIKKNSLKLYINGSFILALILQVFLLIFILWSSTPKYCNKEQIVADIENAQVYMEDIHPNLYAYISKNKIETLKNSLIDKIPEKITDIETYKIFSEFFAYFKDGHILFNIDNYLKRGGILTKNIPPYRFKLKNGKLYIIKNYYYRKNIPIGSEILKINDKPASVCVKEVSKLISHETVQHLNAQLQIPLFWGQWNNFEDLEITYKTTDNQTKTISSSSGLFANISMLYDFTGLGIDNYSFKIINNIGYLYIRHFTKIKKLKKLLDNSFKEIKQKKIKNLIIDIRDSDGGSQVTSEEIMQYISPVSFNSYDISLLKVSKEIIKLNPNIDKTLYIPGSLYKEPQNKVELKKNSLRYNGNCFLLTSGYSFSTASDFAAMFRHFKIGTIIGTETGGRRISFGSPYKFHLKNSNCFAKASMKKLINVGGVQNKGVIIPDYIIENTIKDDINEIDRVLRFAIKIIKKN